MMKFYGLRFLSNSTITLMWNAVLHCSTMRSPLGLLIFKGSHDSQCEEEKAWRRAWGYTWNFPSLPSSPCDITEERTLPRSSCQTLTAPRDTGGAETQVTKPRVLKLTHTKKEELDYVQFPSARPF